MFYRPSIRSYRPTVHKDINGGLNFLQQKNGEKANIFRLSIEFTPSSDNEFSIIKYRAIVKGKVRYFTYFNILTLSALKARVLGA
jgi:hypothetical protein